MEYEVLIFALLGGIIRAVVGIGKHVIRRKEKFSITKVVVTAVTSVFSGAIVGAAFGSDPRLALVSGYAGSDILEGAYKVITGRINETSSSSMRRKR